ncbi:MAG: phosphoethanolamine transferase [Acidaminococcaceae bacterium]
MYEYLDVALLFMSLIGTLYFLLTDIYTKRWVHWRHIFYTLPLFSIAVAYFPNKLTSFILYGTLLVAGTAAMPLLLKIGRKNKIFGDYVLKEIAFGFSLCTVMIFLQILTNWLSLGLAAVIIVTMLQFVYLLVSAIYLLYYGIDGDLLSSTSLVVLYQTNKKEAISFVKNAYSVPQYFIITLGLICLVTALFAANSSLLIQTPVTQTGKAVLTAVMLLSVLNAWATFKESCLWNMISESTVYLKALKYWQLQKKNDNCSAALKPQAKQNDNVFVVVIGESQTKDHLGAYGYQRKTTPWLSEMSQREDFLLFQNAYSCHVLTMYVLAKALTESSQYNNKRFADSVSLIEVAKKAGFKTFFISNHEKHTTFANPVALISDEADASILISDGNQALNTYDEELLPQFASFKDEPGNKLFIIHLKGSHFEYKDRYPEGYNIFDGCQDIYTEEAKRPEKLCQYDNSIFYTDYILSKIYEIATQTYQADGIVYFSDHGDAVKRDQKHTPGMFGFDMTRVPLWVYLGSDYRARHPQLANRLKERLNSGFTNDMIYDTILGIMNIKTDRYDACQDLSSAEYAFKREDLLTMNGTVRIAEDNGGMQEYHNKQEIFA